MGKLVGKGRKHRQVALSNNYREALDSYIKQHKLDLAENQARPLFFGNSGHQLTRAGISHILKKYLVKAARINKTLIPEEITCHSLRHSKAIHLLEAGVTLTHIRDILGHESVTTTEKYARLLGTEYKAKAIAKAYSDFTPNLKGHVDSDNDWLHNYLSSLA